MRKTAICAAAAVLWALAAAGLPAAEPLSFEVASIKRAAPQTGGRATVRMGGGAGRIDYANVSLKDVLKFAYNVRAFQINAPSWMDSERYDILAKIPEGVSRNLSRGCSRH